MAKITIELDTADGDPRDKYLLTALASVFSGQSDAIKAKALTPVEEPEGETAVESAAPKRGRRTRAEIAADEAAQATVTETPAAASVVEATPPAGSTASATSGAAATSTVTLPEINALLTELLGPKHGVTASTLQELVKANTEGTATSPKFADPKYYPGIMAALREIAG